MKKLLYSSKFSFKKNSINLNFQKFNYSLNRINNSKNFGNSLKVLRNFSSNGERESMAYDVCIVGGGPAGLSAAIRVKQLAKQHDKDLSVCVLEKGSEIGAHILSGNVFETRALNELIPDWKEKEAPLDTLAEKDSLYFLTNNSSMPLPTPPSLHNKGNYIISLGNFCRWLSSQAEELGVEIYPGFAASEVLYNQKKEVVGVATNDNGISKSGQLKDNFQRGIELRAKQTIFAEGCRGSLSQEIMATYNLRENCDPQTYALGLKEVWEIDPKLHEPGRIIHSIGWPLQSFLSAKGWGGSFLYHMKPNLILVGFVVGLDYENPYISPYSEFQQWKHHPLVRKYFENGTPISYGARCINEGGIQSIPKLTFPGGVLAGCSAGFLNVPKIKGSHTAMKSGMLAAEAIFDSLSKSDSEGLECVSYEQALKSSWVYEELKEVRNIHPSFSWGVLPWMAYSGLDSFLLKGRVPFTLNNKKTDSEKTKLATRCKPIEYPKPDGKISFDLLTNLARSGTNHEHDQPIHLRIKPGYEDIPSNVSYPLFGGPEQRFCPARVYEYTHNETTGNAQLVRNAQNCLHCKACDIKMPKEYIKWTVPEGGGGPAYSGM
eukprot:TRINITY_DN350_c0_g1_i1.p1 TRINITY_DN350_c0_g1~~TRINITY_DN350_c0_g1_i1.p1  ORF type:complete len:603 (+),score=239.30 TRINITY_DN350_c0_g1_i1:196-2004(+)